MSRADAPGATGDRVVTAALAAALFAVYAAGACRTIYVGDSGELVAAVHVLGIPHPSGYVLYVLLGKLWTLLLPLGSVAFRMSLFSAACAALACALLYRVCRRGFGLPTPLALLAALLAATGPSFWSQAGVQRVYALNALFLVLALGSALRWRETRTVRWLAITSFVCGLGATNHTFMGVVGVCFGLWAVALEPGLLTRPAALGAALASFALGLLPYLYLPLRSRADPPLDWGDPETLGGMIDVVRRVEFWDRRWLREPSDLAPIVWDFLASLGPELAWAGGLLALVGAARALAGRDRSTPRALAALPLLVVTANVLVLALHGSRRDLFVWHRYYVPAYAMLAVLAAIGARGLGRRLPSRSQWAWLSLPAFLLVTGWSAADRSQYRIADDLGRRLLESLPEDARLVGSDENLLFVLTYLHLVEHVRPDVELVLAGVRGGLPPGFRVDPLNEQVFFTHPVGVGPGIELAPVGLVFRALPAGVPPPEPASPIRALAGEDDPRVPKDFLTRSWIGHYHFVQALSLARTDWPEARREVDAARSAGHDDEVLQYNLGGLLIQNGLFAEGRAAFERALALNRGRWDLPNIDPARFERTFSMVSAEVERERDLARAMRSEPALAGVSPDSARFHRLLADRLEAQGAALAARGQRLIALEHERGLRGGGP